MKQRATSLMHHHRTPGSLHHHKPSETPHPAKPSDTPTPNAAIPHYSVNDPAVLRRKAHWIRNELDAQVARDGPDALHADDLLRIDEFLRRLLAADIPLDDIRYSRVHLAITDIARRASRWPVRLVARADAVKEAWEAQYGPLHEIGILLYEPGGRLHGLCKPDDLSRQKLMVKWLKTPGVKFSPYVARRFGDLGFRPGDWWVNAMFALRAGIVDSAEPGSGIVSDAEGVYAILMTDQDEEASPTPETFTYRAKSDDKGRYRLTSGNSDSRSQVRILRSHTLRSFWSPKAGVRYDGLHKVTGWSIKIDPQTKETVYHIFFKRLETEPSMESVLSRPWVEEIEDYKEYKRLRQIAREKHAESEQKRVDSMPVLIISADGTVEKFEDDAAKMPFTEEPKNRIQDLPSPPDSPLQSRFTSTFGVLTPPDPQQKTVLAYGS